MYTNSNILNSRYFNNVEVVETPDEKYVIKSSTNKDKIIAEYTWYKTIGQTINTFYSSTIGVPYVFDFINYDDSASFKMSFIEGYTLKDMFMTDVSDSGVFKNCIQTLYSVLENSIIVPVGDYTKFLIESMYTDKTMKRLSETNLDLDKHYIINSIKTPTIRELVNQSYVEVNDIDIRYPIHGDLCLSNVIYGSIKTSEINKSLFLPSKLFLLDPRAMLTNNKFSLYGDIKYDVGKLAHSIIGLYDYIIDDTGFYVNKLSDYSYNYYINISPQQEKVQDWFKKIYYHYEKYYYDIMIHLFLSMIPLHKDRPDHQEKMLVNAFRIYFLKHNIML